MNAKTSGSKRQAWPDAGTGSHTGRLPPSWVTSSPSYILTRDNVGSSVLHTLSFGCTATSPHNCGSSLTHHQFRTATCPPLHKEILPVMAPNREHELNSRRSMVELKKTAGFTPQGAIARLKDAARSMRRNASRNNLRNQTLSQIIEEDEHSFEDDLEQMTESYNSFSTQQRQQASYVDLTESFQKLTYIDKRSSQQ